MLLHKLLPRPLMPAHGPESPVILGCLLAGVHLDRTRARALGWRGVCPSSRHAPSWTCRVAGTPHVHGLVFHSECADRACVYGTFDAYVFPRSDDPVLDAFPLRALALALGQDYEEAVRELSVHAPVLAPFCLGKLRLTAALDGSGLLLELSAPARLRMVSIKGVPLPTGTRPASGAPDSCRAAAGWVVPPGEAECNVPAFRLLLRLFAVLSATADALLDTQAHLTLRTLCLPRQELAQDRHTPPSFLPETQWLTLSAGLGAAPPAAPSRTVAACTRKDDRRAARSPEGKTLSRLPGRRRPGVEDWRTLPVMHILTGFLGAGKTTFLRRWLDYLNGREQFAAVIQNEFGKMGLDAALTRNETLVEALDEGCVCCSLADSLRPGLQRLLAAAPVDQVILETTGLANPANVLAALKDLSDMVLPGLVITVADALERSGPDAGIRLAQLEQADVIIANKADAVSPQELDAVLDKLRVCNPGAILLPAIQGNIAFAQLDALHTAWLDKQGQPPSHKPRLLPLGATRSFVTHAEEGFASRTLPLPHPVSEEDLRRMLEAAGPGLCRAKGIVDLCRQDKVLPAVVQYASGRLEFEAAPDNVPERYMVFIGVGLRAFHG